jgi:hypothetical protein
MTLARRLLPLAAALFVPVLAAGPAKAEKVGNKVAVFTGLDKITGRIITFDVYTDETVQFGALRVTPRVCYSRPPTESAQTDAFVEVDEITLENEIKRVFTGWMFAASPGLNAVEHPVYDIWLNDCRQESDVPPPGERNGEAREAKANETAPADGDGDQGSSLVMIDGIPIPPERPAALSRVPSVDAAEPPPDGAPAADDTGGEILD